VKKALLIASWFVVLLCALGLHPALRDGAPLAALGREIAGDAARGLDLAGGYGPLAFWALNLSLLYIAGWSLFRLCPARTPAGGIPAALLIAALAGQVAATFASTPTLFYFLSCGIAALSIFAKRDPTPPSGRPWGACLVGFLVVLLASPLDAGLAALTGAPLLPEAWFPLAVEFETLWPIGVALSVVVAAACWAVGQGRNWLGVAPACILVFGPSNPAKGLAAAAVVALLARSGASPLWRSAFLATVVASFVAIAVLL
jgi:uncharacterized membrane protein YhdT